MGRLQGGYNSNLYPNPNPNPIPILTPNPNQGILQDTSDTCVNFALQGKCDTDVHKATTICRASCHIQRICANHTENVLCAKALRCEALMDKEASCAAKAARGPEP